MKYILLSITIIFFSFASQANYTINVCKIPLSRLGFGVDSTSIINIFHVFVKRTTPEGSQSLHFGPITNDYAALVLGSDFPAKISHQDYPEAECIQVLSTFTKRLFEKKWKTIITAHEEAARTHRYHLYNTTGKNCGSVTQSALEDAGLSFPWPNINGQNHTETVLRGLGGDLTDVDNVGNIINSGLKIAEEVIPGSTNNCLIQ